MKLSENQYIKALEAVAETSIQFHDSTYGMTYDNPACKCGLGNVLKRLDEVKEHQTEADNLFWDKVGWVGKSSKQPGSV